MFTSLIIQTDSHVKVFEKLCASVVNYCKVPDVPRPTIHPIYTWDDILTCDVSFFESYTKCPPPPIAGSTAFFDWDGLKIDSQEESLEEVDTYVHCNNSVAKSV